MEECQKTKNKPSIILYPFPAIGHIVSMFELGKLLVQHNFSITMIEMEMEPPVSPEFKSLNDSVSSFISKVSSSNPSISIHKIAPSLTYDPHLEWEPYIFDLFRHSNQNLLQYLNTVPSPPSALILDFFCLDALDVCSQLNIPGYLFWVSCTYSLSSFIHFPKIHDSSNISLLELGSERIDIGQGIPNLPADHFFPSFLHKDNCKYYLNHCRRIVQAKGVVINTIEAIEKNSGTLDVIEEFVKQIYCMGPLVNLESNNGVNAVDCMTWLDKQPKHSVVFLCFGSMGMFSGEQMKEIANGLERSKQRFLWVVRSPPSSSTDSSESDLDNMLPNGFLDRTKDVGLVVKSWVPQAAVLMHESVGGFVTHCGWNSFLEAIRGGVPMIGWPLYGDERLILVYLVEGLKMAVEMKGYDKGIVSAEEVEMKVKWLLESEGGKELRERTVKAKNEGIAALEQGGSSNLALLDLVKELKQLNA